MKISQGIVMALALSVVSATSSVHAQVGITVRFGTRLGPDVGVFAYSRERMGDWHENYRRWTPVTLYDVNGHYYRNAVEGARPVVVYTYNGDYFFPPTDAGWVNFDKRYNYRRRPTEVDFGRAHEYVTVERPDRRLGAELGVFEYAPERAGDWRRNYTRWSPVTVWEFHGHYYQHSAPGARAVQIYRYRDEYFLPPNDRAWEGFDRRFDYAHKPDDDDHRRGRGRP